MVPFYTAIGDGDHHVVTAHGVIPGVKALQTVMSVLLWQHGIVWHELLTVDGFEFGINEMRVFVYGFYSFIYAVV